MARNVIVDDRFGRYSRDVEQALEKSLLEAGQAAAAGARGASSPQDYNISGIQAKTNAALRTYRDRRGRLSLDVVNTDFRGIFFEKGTYQYRSGKVSEKTVSRRQTLSGQQRASRWGDNMGVRPQHFLRKGLTYGQRILMSRIKANMP